jgi:hypothetical protein
MEAQKFLAANETSMHGLKGPNFVFGEKGI